MATSSVPQNQPLSEGSIGSKLGPVRYGCPVGVDFDLAVSAGWAIMSAQALTLCMTDLSPRNDRAMRGREAL